MITSEFAAQVLRTRATGIAGLATARLFEGHPEGLVDDFLAWKGHMRGQVLQLAAALQAEQIDGFAGHIAWTRDAFMARQIPKEVVSSALACMAEVAHDSLPEGVASELSPFLAAANKELESYGKASRSILDQKDPNHALALSYIAALRGGNELEANELILGAFETGGRSLETILDHVLCPALKEMGRLWHISQATVAEEHFVTLATHKILARLVGSAPHAPSNGKTALLSTVAGDSHSFGLQIIASYLEVAGWRTICLGSDTPGEDIAMAARTFSAHVIFLGASLDLQIPSMVQTVELIRNLAPKSKIIVGGMACSRNPNLLQRIAADGVCLLGSDAVSLADQLVA